MKPVAFVIGILLIAQLISCSHMDGTINISKPQPYARERLINSKLKEKAWLEKELEKEIVPNFQGYKNNKLSVKAGGQIDVDINPMNALQYSYDKALVKSETNAVSTYQLIQQEALNQYLEKLKKGDISPTAALSFMNLSTNVKKYQNKNINNNWTMKNYTTPDLGGVSSDSTRAKLTEIEFLNDKKAYRDTVNNYLREIEFDDAHDANGNILRALNFTLSLSPGEKNHSFGKVRLSFNNYSTEKINSEFYGKWVNSLEDKIATEMISIQQRFDMDYLTDEELIKLRYETVRQKNRIKNYVDDLDLFISKAGGVISRNEAALQLMAKSKSLNDIDTSHVETYRTWQESQKAVFEEASNLLGREFTSLANSDKDKIKKALAYLVLNKYYETLHRYVDFSVPELGGLYVSYIIRNAEKEQQFIDSFKNLNKSRKAYIINVEPKNYAQNISDLSNIKKAYEYALGVQAVIPNAGIGISAGTDYLRNSEKQIDAILRKPLLVGFIVGGSNFGWLIGPRFELTDKGKPEFSHIPIDHSVSATVVVPGWWDSLSLTPSYCWINDKGECEAEKTLVLDPTDLTPDYNSVTNIFLANDSSGSQTPVISPRWDNNEVRHKYLLAAGSEESVVIRGRNLWKNSEVFIGSQKADKVELLPDMNGLIAVFNNVKMPTANTNNIAFVDLSVFTSNGVATLRDAVKIINNKSDKQESKFARLTNKYAINNKELKFRIVDSEVFSRNYQYFKLYLRTDPKNDWIESNEIKPDLKDDYLSFPFQLKPGQDISVSPAKLEISLKVKPYPGRDPYDVLMEKTSLIYIKDDADNTLKLQTTKLIFKKDETKSNDVLVVKMPFSDAESIALYKIAHPEIFNSDFNVNYQIIAFDEDGFKKPALKFSVAKNGDIEISGTELDKLKPKSGASYTLKLSNDTGDSFLNISPKLTVVVESK